MGIQTTIIPTNLPSFPWSPGDRIYAVPLNNAFIALQNQVNSLQGQITLLDYLANGGSAFGTSVTISWGGGAPVTPGPYVVTASAPYQFSLQTLTANVGSNGGYFTATVEADGTAIPGLTNIVINSATDQTFTASPPNTVPMAGNLTVIISDVNGQPSNAYLTFNSALPVVVPVYVPTIGIAYGSEIVGAVSKTIVYVSNSTASGHGDATGKILAYSVGQTIGTASGTGAAIGRMVFNGIYPTLILDDTTQPGLDFDPLG